MSTNHTEHYHLSQWERTDKVLMDDFNADNAKIDAALFNHPSGELIAQVTVEEETAQLELDISGLDWSRYLALVLVMESGSPLGFKIDMSSGIEREIYIHTNSFPPSTTMDLAGGPDVSHMTVILPVLYDGSHCPLAFSLGGGKTIDDYPCLGGGSGQRPLSTSSRIRIDRYASGTFPAGDRVMLWGIK